MTSKDEQLLKLIDDYINLAAGSKSQFLSILLGIKQGIREILNEQPGKECPQSLPDRPTTQN